MSLRTTLLLATLGTAAVLALLLATHEWGFGTRPDGSQKWNFLLEDRGDRAIYEQRGRWLPSGRTPYIEEHSEYPQLSTWLFGVPYLFFDSEVPVGREQTPAEYKAVTADHETYSDLHHVSMAVSYWLLLALTALNLRALRLPTGWALLLFLPGSVYFAFNRFDAWPAAAVAGALLLQWRGKRSAAAALLGVGAMLKWYPLLLLPLFLAHNLHGRAEEDEADLTGSGRGAPGGARTGAPGATRTGEASSDARGLLARFPAAVLRPGLAAAAVCLGVLAITWFWDNGGLEAVTKVYRWHMDREPNAPSIIWALTVRSRWNVFSMEDRAWLGPLLTALQFLPAVLLALLPIRSRRALILGCLIVVLGFMQFGKVFSPQWICWVTPLAVLVAARSRICLVLLVAAELAIYVQMPVMFFEALTAPGNRLGSPALWAACDVRIAVLAAFWAWSLAAFLRTVLARTPAPAVSS